MASACMHAELVFICSHHFRQYMVNHWYTLLLKDHAIVKVLLDLRKHALQVLIGRFLEFNG